MLYTKTIEPETLFLLEELMGEPLLKDFILVGGTALSLLKGHRNSDDIDLFTDKDFDIEQVKHLLKSKYNRGTLSISDSSFGLKIIYNNIPKNHQLKIDIMNFSTDPFLNSPDIIDDIRIASLQDIAAMKFNAVKTRHTKKDFIDIHLLLKDFSFNEMLNFNKQRFIYEDVKDCLIGFSEIDKADSSPMPKMIIPLSWEEVKINLKKEAKNYFNSIIENNPNKSNSNKKIDSGMSI